MREIKFRAWHEEARTMLFDDTPGDCLGFANEGQPVTVMQSTGLKDKNGKEIYEGDILKETAPRGNIYQVFRVPGGFAINQFQDERDKIRTFCEPLAHDQTRSCVQSQCEVIGNIHENPELLEAQS